MSGRSFQLKAILSAVDKLTPVLNGVKRAAGNTRKHLSDMASAAGDVASRIGLPIAALTGILGGGLLIGMRQVMTGFMDVGDKLDKMSKRTGIGVEALQLLQYQAELSDVSMEGLQSSVSRLNKGIGEAAAGKNKDLAALLAKLKINVRGANGELRGAADLLPEIADAFKRNTSEVVRARMGTTLFGKGYAELLPLLVDGSEALKDAEAQYRRLGAGMTAEQSKAAADLADAFTRARYATQGIGYAIGAKLAPVVTPLVEQFALWAAANRDVLATRFAAFADGLARSIERIDLIALLDGMGNMIDRTRSVVQALGGLKTILIALGVLMAAGPLFSVVQLAGAIGRFAWFVGTGAVGAVAKLLPVLKVMASLFAGSLLTAVARLGMALRVVFALLAANPILLVIAGIAAAAFLVIKHWDTVKQWFTEFFDWIGGKWEAFSGWVKGVASAVGGFFGGGGGGVQAPAQQSSLVTAGSQRVGGSIAVDFRNAPAGMRVADTRATPGFDLNASVGYRGFALDGP